MKIKTRSFTLTLILTAMTAWNISPAGPWVPSVRASRCVAYDGQPSRVIANGKIIYVSQKRENNADTYTIHSINPDGSDHVQLTSGPKDFSPVWSPDGSQIAFMRGQGQRYEIELMNADGSGQRSLTPPEESDVSPAWSPDGKHLVFVRGVKEGDPTHGQIFTMSADGSNRRRLTHPDEFDHSPVWSPDGEKIAFLRYSRYGESLFVIEADGEEKRIGGIIFGFSWSPDGSSLAVSSYESLYIINADGSGLRTLTVPPVNSAFDVASDALPAWSSDGSRIAFTRFLGCNIELVDCKSEQLWVVNADGSNPRQLLDRPVSALIPSWSPDSHQILSCDTDLFVVDADKGGMTKITDTDDIIEFSPSWQPIVVSGCAVSVSAVDVSFEAEGGTGSIEVTAASDCGWTAVSYVGWINITLGGGAGNGSVSYSVAANDGSGSRTARFIVAGHIVTVAQAGAPARIFGVRVEGKQLFVFGERFDPGAVILLNGEEQITKNDHRDPKTTLIAKKAGKKVKPGDKLQVRNPNGPVSPEFIFAGE